jgi:hypothetical protein
MLAVLFSWEKAMRIQIREGNKVIAVLFWGRESIKKYNHHHDKLGRFASSDGSGGGSSLLEVLSSLSRHRSGDKVEITEQAIQKVPEKASEYLSDEENKILHDMNVNVLRESMRKNDSNEVAQTHYVIDENGKIGLSDLIHGDQYSVDIEADPATYHSLSTCPSRSLLITHNHPGASSFSEKDLALFMKYRSIKCLSIVTNKGKIFSLTKTRDMGDCKEFYSYAKEISKRYKNDEEQRVALLIAKLYNYGVRYER